jgi:hypothetical protein
LALPFGYLDPSVCPGVLPPRSGLSEARSGLDSHKWVSLPLGCSRSLLELYFGSEVILVLRFVRFTKDS